MPEDGIPFSFKEITRTEAETRLADEIFTLQTMTRTAETFGEDTKTTETTAETMDKLDWDGNVPPDFCDEFSFLM